jgi:hypothetical protein
MRLLLAAASVFFLAAAAHAQETPPAPAATPAECRPIPPDPAMVDGATVSMEQMGEASDAFAAWRREIREAHECRRLQFNAVVERYNAVNQAWGAQLDAFCARRNIRCAEREGEQTPAN